MTSILSLDVSKYCGWSYFKSADAKPQCRTWIAEGLWNSDDYSPYFVAFEEWLMNMIQVFQPDVVAWESPIILPRRDGRGSDENNVRRLIGIVSIAELVCARLRIRCFEAHNQTCKAFVGVSRFKDKNAMIVAMTERGYEVADQHQGDACAVALVVFSQLEELP